MVIMHMVFSTKNRRRLIPPELSADVHAYLAATFRELGSDAYRAFGTDNHVHVACTLPRTIAVAELLKQVKASSSGWLKKKDPRCRKFAWQGGYGAFSISRSQLPQLVRYIETQIEHHQRQSYEDELRGLLKRYEADYNETYLWD
jgi:REP element-mobilizing transposase RayT